MTHLGNARVARNELFTSDKGRHQNVEESGGHFQDEEEISQICAPLLCSKVCLQNKIVTMYLS